MDKAKIELIKDDLEFMQEKLNKLDGWDNDALLSQLLNLTVLVKGLVEEIINE
jgi:hypothetical protein